MSLTCSRYPLTGQVTTVSDPPARLVVPRLETNSDQIALAVYGPQS